jgi:hypothetical protein
MGMIHGKLRAKNGAGRFPLAPSNVYQYLTNAGKSVSKQKNIASTAPLA